MSTHIWTHSTAVAMSTVKMEAISTPVQRGVYERVPVDCRTGSTVEAVAVFVIVATHNTTDAVEVVGPSTPCTTTRTVEVRGVASMPEGEAEKTVTEPLTLPLFDADALEDAAPAMAAPDEGIGV